jgi:hypothetical protein
MLSLLNFVDHGISALVIARTRNYGDEAIQILRIELAGLLRFARNDEFELYAIGC